MYIRRRCTICGYSCTWRRHYDFIKYGIEMNFAGQVCSMQSYPTFLTLWKFLFLQLPIFGTKNMIISCFYQFVELWNINNFLFYFLVIPHRTSTRNLQMFFYCQHPMIQSLNLNIYYFGIATFLRFGVTINLPNLHECCEYVCMSVCMIPPHNFGV